MSALNPVAPVDIDVPQIVELNNSFAPSGLTLARTADFISSRLDSYLVVKSDERVVGTVCIDDYSPSLAEVISLAVAPAFQGQGLGRALLVSAVALAKRRGYDMLFAVSYSDKLFLSMGYEKVDVRLFPEKQARYGVVADEMEVAKKHCFAIRIPYELQAGAVYGPMDLFTRRSGEAPLR